MVMCKKLTAKTPDTLQSWKERNTPLPGNKCRKKGCGGTVVQKNKNADRGVSHPPKYCGECDRPYLVWLDPSDLVGDKKTPQKRVLIFA
jgi:hypothetical protein